MPVADRVNHIARIDAHFACAQLACAYGVHQAVGGLCILRLIRSSSQNFECRHRSRMIVSAAPLSGEPRHHEQLECLRSSNTPSRVAIQFGGNEDTDIVDCQVSACENRDRALAGNAGAQRLQLAHDRA